MSLVRARRILILATLAIALPACSVNVKKSDNGQDKNVDIDSPVGGIHVSNDVDVRDTGLPVYPGARPKPKDKDGDEKSANVNIQGFGFGLRVIAVEYQSDDAPAKLIAFYQDQLKKYGKVLECHTSGHKNYSSDTDDHGSKELKCDEGRGGNNIELKAGTRDNQHIVAIEPNGTGSNLGLVYIRTHGKDTSI